MYREILNQLAEWKDKEERKTLLFSGGKGVGKSYTLNDFGEGCFANTCMVDFKEQEYIRFLFEDKLDKNLILKKLSISLGESIVEGETLLVFENVDILPNATDIVEFLCEELKEYHVVFTLSRLEKYFLEENENLIDKIDIINIYPLSFSEFLIVNKENAFCERISSHARKPLNDLDMMMLNHYLRLYLVVGGMPGVVKTYLETKSLEQVETEKMRILMDMISEIEDIKSEPLRKKVKQIFDSIPAQLEKENKKFQYGAVKLTARAREYKDALQWLLDNKFVVPLYRAREPIAPLKGQMDEKSFELFLSDIGLLVSMFGLTYKEIEEIEEPFKIKGGALVEQYIYSELLHNPNIENIYYWISEATARIEFVFQDDDAVIPIEVNLDLNEKAQSLKVFRSKYKVPMAIRISRDKINMSQETLTLPLFSIWNL